MLGDIYYINRQELTEIIRGILSLADDVGADVSGLTKTGLLSDLAAPFTFVVCGEVNAGKSSFLNALIGTDLCEVSANPAKDVVRVYRYGNPAKESLVAPALCDCPRTEPFLKRFAVVDTPGTNSFVKGQAEETESILSGAECSFFVFPVGNPWGSTTWDLLGKLSEDQLSRAVLILQQTDLRDSRDTEVIMDHMRRLAVQRIGSVPPIYPVSAHIATRAKAEERIDARLYTESGYRALESTLNDKVNYYPARRSVMRSVHAEASEVLQRIEQRLSEKASEIESHIAFIRHLEMDIDRVRQANSAEKSGGYSALADVFTKVVDESSSLLGDGLRTWPSLRAVFLGSRLQGEVEEHLVQGAQSAVETHSGDDARALIRNCADHWETLIPRVEERLGFTLSDFDPESKGFEETRKKFSVRLSNAARQAVVKLRLRAVMDVMVTRRLAILKFLTGVSLLVLTLAGVLGAMSFPWMISVALLLSGLFGLLGTLLFCLTSQGQVVMAFEERAHSARREFVQHLGEDYRDGVRQFFSEYGILLEDLRRHVGKSKKALKPLDERWHSLFLQLKAIEQSL